MSEYVGLALSTAGHDRGTLYLVLALLAGLILRDLCIYLCSAVIA